MTKEEITEKECMAIMSRLRELREQQGLSTYALAEVAGIRQTHISRAENGGQMPSLRTLVRWTRALGVKVSIE